MQIGITVVIDLNTIQNHSSTATTTTSTTSTLTAATVAVLHSYHHHHRQHTLSFSPKQNQNTKLKHKLYIFIVNFSDLSPCDDDIFIPFSFTHGMLQNPKLISTGTDRNSYIPPPPQKPFEIHHPSLIFSPLHRFYALHPCRRTSIILGTRRRRNPWRKEEIEEGGRY